MVFYCIQLKSLSFTLCMLGNFSRFYCRLPTSFSNISFRKGYTIRVLNGLDPDQDQHSVGTDLGPNCLQRLSAGDNSHH